MTTFLILYFTSVFFIIFFYLLGVIFEILVRLKIKNPIIRRIHERLSIIRGLILIGKPIGAILYLNPNRKKITTFRNLAYGSLINFILIQIIVIRFMISNLKEVNFITVLAVIYIGFYLVTGFRILISVLNRIQVLDEEIKEAQRLLNGLNEEELGNPVLLKKLLITEHAAFAKNLVEYNIKIFDFLKRCTSKENHYIIENVKEVYQRLLKRYNRNFGLKFLTPKLILLSKNYSAKLDKQILDSIEKIDIG